jgi:hypothetical protein
MSREHTYLPTSWESVTRQIKEYFCWDVLTEESASAIMKLYLKGTPTEQIIKQLEENKC